jgi:23S rRNA (uracil1939-C5)-methyltransferase
MVRTYAHDHGITFYDIRNRKGMLRSLIVRNNRKGEVMLIFSFFEGETEVIDQLIHSIYSQVPGVKSVYYCLNQKVNDTILDLPLVHAWGDEYLVETLHGVQFLIGPKSFFQTNPEQAENLFSVASSFCGLTGTEVVYDLYCGVGSIALTIAGQCREVIGIEEVPAAIEDARQNAALNGIANARFYAGDVRELMDREMIERHGSPDILITDPPRAGMHPDVVQSILGFGPGRIVYVSCNVSTQARDVQLLSEKYRVARSRAVDMFPHTHHIENVILLEKLAGR